jgi:hypothetical protein
MWLVLNDERNVGRNVTRILITFTGEGNLGATLPAWLDSHGEDFVLSAGLSVGTDNFPKNAKCYGELIFELTL